mgnify:CR=1 FL=1
MTESSSPTPSQTPSDSAPGLSRRTVLRAGALAGAAVGTVTLSGQAATAGAAPAPGGS